jgi:ATP-dependent exoDNAse (exonuclease V) beta subunit
MTIHKSKGLEFDTVILPSLDKKGANDTAGLLTWQKLAEGDDLHDIIAPLDKDKSPLFIWLQSLEKKKADYELDRLLYVALTRAVKQLIVIATLNPSKDKAGWKIPSASNSLMGCLWRVPAIQASTQSLLDSLPAPEDMNETEDAQTITPFVIPSLLRFSQTQLLQAQQTLSVMPQYLVQNAQPSLTALVDTNSTSEHDSDASDGVAAQIGTVTHALLERIANDGLAQWTIEHLQQQTRWLEYQLRSLGVPVSKQDGAIATIMQAVNNTLSDDKGRWILHHWQQARNEWTLMDVDERTGKLQRHILDRSFIDAQGVRWIIDYKTSQLMDGDCLTFVQQKRQLYQPQLARYAHLVRQLDSEHPIQTALFFPLLPVAERWQLVHQSRVA